MIRGLYIHFPFCRHICNYCDFFVLDDLGSIDLYINTLIKEIDQYFDLNPDKIGCDINSIYIGGGTPSLMSSDHLSNIYRTLIKYLKPTRDIEFSMEANPSSITFEKAQAYKEIGLNRISIGVQSFVKRELGKLTRDHSPNKAIKAINEAYDAGIDNINLDLIFSIPDQSEDSFIESLKVASDLPIKHISTYSLIYEPGTKLYNKWKEGKISKLSDEQDADLYERSIDFLTSQGFEQYEVSNFAREGMKCQHNLGAWHQGEYFAFGVSSHGFIDGVRFANHRDLPKYIKDVKKGIRPLEKEEELNDRQIFEEYIFLGLRADGISLKRLKERISDTVELDQLINELTNSGYIKKTDDNIKLTKKGYLICDSITFKIIDRIVNFVLR